VCPDSRTVMLIPNWPNSTGGSPYSLSKAHLAPLLSENHHSASRTLTTNQPWVTGMSPDPESPMCASVPPTAPATITCAPLQRFLLTSAGITNATIDNALVDLLGKPIAESSALCIPTGVQPFPGGPSHVYQFITGSAPSPMCELGWKSLGVLELTALPSIKEAH